MKFLVLLTLLLTSCASSQKNFCQKVWEAENNYDFPTMRKLLTSKLENQTELKTPQAKEEYLLTELKRCGYDIH